MHIAIHSNPAMPHQQAYAHYFRQGFIKHGITAEVTASPTQGADIHVVLGPHYAKDQWIGHPRVILLDRAYYHDEKVSHVRSMDWVSIGWMRADGGRHYFERDSRDKPIIENHPQGQGTIFLRDHGGPMGRADTIRFHPAERPSTESLQQALLRHRIAIGHQTSALVKAGLMGLTIDCRDKRNIMFEKNWLQLLPWAEWNYQDIQSGELWSHLHSVQDQLNTL